jgi:hypothetical protein
LKITQCVNPPASGSSTIKAKLCVPAGGSPHANGGEISSPLQEYWTGISPSGSNAVLLRLKAARLVCAVTESEGAAVEAGAGASAEGDCASVARTGLDSAAVGSAVVGLTGAVFILPTQLVTIKDIRTGKRKICRGEVLQTTIIESSDLAV